MSGEGHDHANDGGLDWFKVLDVVVWVSVGIIGILAAEWFLGLVVRERIAAGASRHLKAAAPSE